MLRSILLIDPQFKTIISLVLIMWLSTGRVVAQDEQRYLGITLVNEGDQYKGLDDIRSAGSVGFNAALLSVHWGAIHGQLAGVLRQENGAEYNLWKQYDDQINLAVSLSMKVGLNINIATEDSVSQGESGRYGEETGDGWLREERVLCVGMDGTEAVYQKYGGLMRPPNLNVQRVMTSLAAKSTKTRIEVFTREVIGRYKYLQEESKLLYVNLVWTRTQEGEFEWGTDKWDNGVPLNLGMLNSFSDYSKPIVEDYRSWLVTEYGNDIEVLNKKWFTDYKRFDEIQPKNPSSGAVFSGSDGHDWYRYRTHLLKETNELFKRAVAREDSAIRVISHHGSVYDRISFFRNTFSFNEIAADLDGVKINDALAYDHRFALDLIRSNLPGKFYVNEAEYAGPGVGLAPLIQLAEESFDHGANVVTFFNMNST
ncbi:beta-galactosidase, partial [Persicitalea sp.]|uniref:beta-galactosidase n=1 Tax=Persicitalea sp. TaxID=3100273 RepID=UPI00359314E6